VIGLRTCAVALAAAVTLGGCADRVVGIRPAAVAVAPAVAPAAGAPSPCRFHVDAIEDQRDGQDLGIMGPTRVSGEGFAAWFQKGIAATPGHSVEPASVRVRIAVAKAYIQGLSTLKSANIVVKVHLTDAQGASTDKLYRGVENSTNWWNSETEIQDAFDAALADLRRQLAADLAASCHGKS
jgi:hypothetical protein